MVEAQHEHRELGVSIVMGVPQNGWFTVFTVFIVFIVPQTASLLGFYSAFYNWILSRDDFAVA